jgi:hypothetical protein
LVSLTFMILNPKYERLIAKHFPNSMEAMLAKVILFSVEHELNVFPIIDTERVNWHHVYEKLIILGILRRKATSRVPKFELSEDLYADTSEIAKTKTHLNRTNIEGFLRDRVDEYRNLFSINGEGTKGLKLGAMGDRKATIRKNLKKWFY